MGAKEPQRSGDPRLTACLVREMAAPRAAHLIPVQKTEDSQQRRLIHWLTLNRPCGFRKK